ncbi:SGNH/GDSL hydrolase family protein [Sphingomonas sp. S2-65]|uniref:SGNH/GDSL hydrolase family protein n=1 Tax=Sphingomonas sp. S2-65 TaxID=2903960 RepID=UPI001F19F9A1|nr:SGNH/GDSL hydrolase family protein [Sphingomonas sp. S2-65]UYY59249.1 SGNH/GDSL hydrolase family protein [Sphingomonas sp. S2-65]
MVRLGRTIALIAAMLIADPVTAGERWVSSWGSAQMVPTDENVLPQAQASNVTLRQFVRLSAAGKRIRVRFSNAFGTQPLAIGAAHLGRPVRLGAPGLMEGGRQLRFGGQPGIIIAAGAEVYSDPVDMTVPSGGDVAVSLYLPQAPVGQTGHPGSRTTSFLIPGNQVAEREPVDATPTTRWWGLADVEVEVGESAAGAVVAIGDSITDGYGVLPDTNARWTDMLAVRLRGEGIGVVNAGIGGNRILRDGSGPNLLARFDRDVIARSGVRWAIVLEGVNDLGVLTRDAPATPQAHADIVTQLIQAYSQLVARAHAHGIKVIGGTIMPFGGNGYYHPGPELEADRQAVNRFIRTSGLFDAVIDFDRIMRDPAQPDRLNPAYDSGDHLHPSIAGYRAMGEAVPLTLFKGK